MSFDTEYPNRKDWRSPYHDARRFSRNCRNHRGCDYCRQNRQHDLLREKERTRIELRAYRNGRLWMTEAERRFLELQEAIARESATTLLLNQFLP